VGNPDRGDDGAGVRLSEALLKKGVPDVLVAGTTPETCLARLIEGRFDQVVFLDAAVAGQTPGSVVFLNAAEIAARFPQVSTHRLSLGLLARTLEKESGARVWLIGVEPEHRELGKGLSPAVEKTVAALAEIIGLVSESPNQWK
jgi:hydrogenase maturation protease